MTNQEKFTPAQLALLDQRLAQFDLVVNDFVDQAATQIGLDGQQVATAAIADHLAKELNEDQLASIAAIALARLAIQLCPCLPGAPQHEHLRGGYSLDTKDKT